MSLPQIPDWVYLIRFSSGTVKVGRTKRIDPRIQEHEKNARAHGASVSETWCAMVHDGCAAEDALLSEARRAGRPVPGNPEFFEGLDFDTLRDFATGRFGDRASQERQGDIEIAQAMERIMAGL